MTLKRALLEPSQAVAPVRFRIDRLPTELLVFGPKWTPSPACTVRGSVLGSAERGRHPSIQLLLPCRAEPCRRSNEQSTGDQPTSATVQTLINLQDSRRCCHSFQTLLMPNKDRPLVDRHLPKNGEGWLMSAQEQKVCRFRNDMPTQHAQWVVVETRPLRGGGQPVVRRMLRHNAIEAWETMQKSGGWKRCPPKW